MTAAPFTVHTALCATEVSPVRVTVKVNAVVPDWPSTLSALVAAIDRDASSLRMVPNAVAVASVAPVLGFDNLTLKASLASCVVSPATLTVMIFDVSPAAKLTVPEGRTPPTKSAPLTVAPPTVHIALCATEVSPVRVTVKVNAVVPDWPSTLSALVAVIVKAASVASSLRMVPNAVAVASVAPVLGFDNLTLKASLASCVVSPATLTVMIFDVSPAAKLTVPEGRTPPTKSAPLTVAPPTVHTALCATEVSPVRVTVKVNAVVPDWPSTLSALVAAIDRDASSLWIVPDAAAVAVAVASVAPDTSTVIASEKIRRWILVSVSEPSGPTTLMTPPLREIV